MATSPSRGATWLAGSALLLLLAFGWSYWPTLVGLVRAWDAEPDYSHGFLVVPIAAYFLWARRDGLADISISPAWGGFSLLLVATALRLFGALFYVDAVDGWTIPLWIGGGLWLLGGWHLFRWAAPSIAFLLFMVPLPYRAETVLSVPLQRVATAMSTWSLQMLGQPALAEGNVIHLGDQLLEVEQACSGLRMLVGVAALAFAYVLISRRSWWERLLLVACILPIALLANTIRIVGTGLLYQHASDAAARLFIHDVSGYLMIPLAAAMFWLVLVYLSRLVYEVAVIDVEYVLQEVVPGEESPQGSAPR